MNDVIIPPAFAMLAGAFIIPFLPSKIKGLRSVAFVFFAFCSLAIVFMLPDGATLTAKVMNYKMTLVKVDSLSRVFGIIFAFIATAGGIYSFHIKETGQQCAALLYAGGALGVTFAGDFFTLFIYWEMMAVASTYLIWARRTTEAQKAGFRYLLYHVLGGGILFMGILLHISSGAKSIEIVKMTENMGLAGWLMLIGVVINAAVPPLHAWLADAYPKGTITGSVFLSAFTTKTAVYVLARVFPGVEVLLWAGVIMTLYGVIFAVLANDIRGILAYHIISQVGYMVAGVGLGTEMAINGAVSHAFSHILYKALLFMGTGAVLYSTGKSKLTDLGGLGKHQKFLCALYLVAAFSISGFPLFNGFISKSMTVAAAGAEHQYIAMFGMILAAVGTFLSVGLKLPYFTWFSKEKPKDLEVKPLPKNMYIGMSVVAFFCIFHGLYPQQLYSWLPYAVNWSPFTMHHFVETVQLLIFTFVAFWIWRFTLIKPKPYIALDLDWFYRKPAKYGRIIFVNPVDNLYNAVESFAHSVARKLTVLAKNPMIAFSSKTPEEEPYTPNKYRPLSQRLVMAIIGLFIVVVFLGLVF